MVHGHGQSLKEKSGLQIYSVSFPEELCSSEFMHGTVQYTIQEQMLRYICSILFHCVYIMYM